MRIFYLFSIILCALTISVKAEDNPFGITFYGSYWHTKNVPNALFFIDEIKKNDSFNLRKALRNHDVQTIVLASPGGDVDEGLQMAGIIFDKELTTVVPVTGDCASACAFMFFGGKSRLANGRLGVHQFKSSKDGEAKIGQVQEGTQFYVSEIIGFLNEFETPRFVFEKMFQQSEMYYFSDDELAQLNANESEIEVAQIESFLEDFGEYLDNQEKKKRKDKSEPKITEKEFFSMLQKRLNEAGCSAGVVDGIFGRRTERAVKLFAKTANLNYIDDLIYSENFLSKLASAPAKFFPVLKKATPPKSNLPPRVLAGIWDTDSTCRGRRVKGVLSLFFAGPYKSSSSYRYNAYYIVNGNSYNGTLMHYKDRFEASLSGENGRLAANGRVNKNFKGAYGVDSSKCEFGARKRQ